MSRPSKRAVSPSAPTSRRKQSRTETTGANSGVEDDAEETAATVVVTSAADGPSQLTGNTSGVTAATAATLTAHPQPSEPITSATREYLSEYNAKRLSKFVTTARPSSNCYAISAWPGQGLGWGQGTRGKHDMHTFLCINDEPVMFWIVGEIDGTMFRDKENYAARAATVRIRPLLEADRKTCFDQMQQWSRPVPQSNADKRVLWVKQWMAEPDVPKDQIEEFMEAYDARASYRSRELFPDKNFAKNDIVLVEAYLHRYADWKTGEGPAISATGEWKKWRAEFWLMAVNLLVRAPNVSLARKVEDIDL